jgi:hypothetical protein
MTELVAALLAFFSASLVPAFSWLTRTMHTGRPVGMTKPEFQRELNARLGVASAHPVAEPLFRFHLNLPLGCL